MEICFGQIKKVGLSWFHLYLSFHVLHIAPPLSGVRERPSGAPESQDRPSEHVLGDSTSSLDAGIRSGHSHVGSRTDTSEIAKDSILQLSDCKLHTCPVTLVW